MYLDTLKYQEHAFDCSTGYHSYEILTGDYVEHLMLPAVIYPSSMAKALKASHIE